MSVKKTLIVIVGPTAIGKSAIAIKIASHFKTEIISADSRQFYKELNAGTAKPAPEELRQVKHHFINSLSIHDAYDVGQFEMDAIKCLGKIFNDHEIAVAVGGSGLFIDALCHGLDQLPESDPDLRNELKKLFHGEGIEALQGKLSELDPEYYHVVDRSNPHRLIRAIEVCLLTGMKYSDLRKKTKKKRDFTILKIGLDDDRLKVYRKINERVDAMIKNGLAEEAKIFHAWHHLNALQTVGYKEFFEYFEKRSSLEETVELIKRNTRRYAKRQLTWFRKDPEIKWFRPEEKNEIIEFLDSQI